MDLNISDVSTETLCDKQRQSVAAAAATAATTSAAVAQDDGITPVSADHDEEQGAVGGAVDGAVGGHPSHRVAIRDGAIAASFEVSAA